MSCTCTGTTTSTGRLAWGAGAGGSGGPSRGSPQDTRVSAPLLLLLPNNILVLSELQTETPASVILLRRGCTAIGGHWTLPTLHGWVPMRVPSAAGRGTWGKFAVGILASVGPATAGVLCVPLLCDSPGWSSGGEPSPEPGLTLPGDTCVLLGSAHDGRTDKAQLEPHRHSCCAFGGWLSARPVFGSQTASPATAQPSALTASHGTAAGVLSTDPQPLGSGCSPAPPGQR